MNRKTASKIASKMNDQDAFANYVQERLESESIGWLVSFIMDHAWEDASEEYNNDWIDECESEEDPDSEDDDEE